MGFGSTFAMMSRILLACLPVAAFASYTAVPISSLDKFKQEYRKYYDQIPSATKAATALKLNEGLESSTEPDVTDQRYLWALYSQVDGTVKTEAQAFVKKMESDNMLHDQLLLDFKTQMESALASVAGAGEVAVDAKNFEAIFGEAKPLLPTDTGAAPGITANAQPAWNALQKLTAANKKHAKQLAEDRLYDAWKVRFEAVSSQFSGTSGFLNILKCLKDTVSTSVPLSDSWAGESGWAVYSRVSDATKAKLKAAIIKKLSASTSAV